MNDIRKKLMDMDREKIYSAILKHDSENENDYTREGITDREVRMFRIIGMRGMDALWVDVKDLAKMLNLSGETVMSIAEEYFSICENCGKRITEYDIKVYRDGVNHPDGIPSYCADCAELESA